MKAKNIALPIVAIILIILGGILIILLRLNSLWKKEFNKFDYDEAYTSAINYLNENEKELNKIVDELYKTKSSKKNPTKDIRYTSYNYLNDFNFKYETEYIIFDLNGQGMLGGQNYGLIYSKENNDSIIIYDEYKKTGNGNNIFIRKKIRDNWFFYYNDYDGKVNVDKIK